MNRHLLESLNRAMIERPMLFQPREGALGSNPHIVVRLPDRPLKIDSGFVRLTRLDDSNGAITMPDSRSEIAGIITSVSQDVRGCELLVGIMPKTSARLAACVTPQLPGLDCFFRLQPSLWDWDFQ